MHEWKELLLRDPRFRARVAQARGATPHLGLLHISPRKAINPAS